MKINSKSDADKVIFSFPYKKPGSHAHSAAFAGDEACAVQAGQTDEPESRANVLTPQAGSKYNIFRKYNV